MRPEHLPPAGAAILDWGALPADAVEVARVTGAWGVGGWLKIRSYSASADALFHATTWFLQPGEGVVATRVTSQAAAVSVEQIKDHSGVIVAQCAGITDRDVAQQLRGAAIFIRRADFPPATEGEYYWVDLIGARVANRSGTDLGAVTDLLQAGPQEVLVVHDGAQERLIPFVDAYVDRVDLAAGRIDVDWQADY